jgi:hypothetical protein
MAWGQYTWLIGEYIDFMFTAQPSTWQWMLVARTGGRYCCSSIQLYLLMLTSVLCLSCSDPWHCCLV